MAENLTSKLIPHQGCVITRKGGDVELMRGGQGWIMSAAVCPNVYRAPFAFRVIGKTDSTNLRMHWHQGELIFNWECSVRELRIHDPATGEQTAVPGKGFLTTGEWHDILWEVKLR
jgi:hypothetical protein